MVPVRDRRSGSPFASILARETFLARFPQPSRHALPVAAGYPAPYRVGMASLGFQFLYGSLRGTPLLAVERFFADTSSRTLETGAPLASKTALFVSVSYEEDCLNLVRVLRGAGIEALRERRGGGPIVVAGGPAPSANPAPLSAVADAIALGEGEGTAEAIVRVLVGEGAGNREGILDGLARVPGVLVPGRARPGAGFNEPVRGERFPHSVVVTPESAFPDTLLVESGRGCPGACAFCLATSIYRPFRFMPFSSIEEIVDGAAAPVRAVGLVSTAVAANPDFAAIVRGLLRRGIAVSFSSLRAEDLDEEKIRLIGAAGTTGASLAPESGSERVRYRLGKHVPDELYCNVGARLREAGVRRFTLYLLTGCPGEDDGAIEATGRFLARFGEAVRGAAVAVHVNPLVPKPWTPFQYWPMPPERELERRQALLERTIRAAGMRPRTKSVRSAVRQALFSLGDERLGLAIALHAGKDLSWNRALAEAGVDAGFAHAKKGPETSFPWDGVSGPARRGALYRRFVSISGEGPDAAGELD